MTLTKDFGYLALGTSSCNTFGSPHLLLTNFRYTRSSCISNASQLLQSFFVSSDSPSISSFVGLTVYIRRNCTIRLNSRTDRCCSMRLSLTEEVSTSCDVDPSLIRSIAFTFGRHSLSGSVVLGLRIKSSALPSRFILRPFLYRLSCTWRLLFLDMPNLPRIAVFSLLAFYSDTNE